MLRIVFYRSLQPRKECFRIPRAAFAQSIYTIEQDNSNSWIPSPQKPMTMIDPEKQRAIDMAFNKGWFSDLNRAEVTRLVDVSTIERFKTNQRIYNVGQRQDSVYCVIDGLIKISIAGKEHEKFPLTIWESGNWFGEGAFHESSVMPLEATAMSEATVLAVPLSEIDTTLDHSALFYKNILRDMVQRTQMLYKLVEMLLFDTLKARVSARILHLIQLFGEPVDDGILLPMEFNQADFARMSGGSRQRVNKIFRNWADEGILTKRDKLYVLHKPAKLQAELSFTEF